MQQNKPVLILVETFQNYIRLHYEDGHYEVILGYVQDYVVKKVKGYKRPIRIESSYLYPTKNIQDETCKWLNLEYYKNANRYYETLLENYHLEKDAQKMYLKYVKKRL